MASSVCRVVWGMALGVFLSIGAAQAAPTGGATAGSILSDAVSCAEARKAVDADRGRIEALMLTMSAEDEKPESPARFKRMCAIDSEISGTAARLARLIAAAPAACLSKEDRAAVAEMKRLSTPVPECKAAGKTKTAQAPAKSETKLKRTAKLQPAKAQGAKALPKVPRSAAGSAIPQVSPGLMSDLY